MNKHKQRGYLPDLTSFFIFLILAGVVIGVVSSFGVPFLWELIKPLIHAATA